MRSFCSNCDFSYPYISKDKKNQTTCTNCGVIMHDAYDLDSSSPTQQDKDQAFMENFFNMIQDTIETEDTVNFLRECHIEHNKDQDRWNKHYNQ